MFDLPLRATGGRVLRPVADRLALRIAPGWLTLLALCCGLGAATAAATDTTWLAVGLWLLARLLDGLDGAVARAAGRASDLGGYLDMLADAVVYAAVPVGIAIARADSAVWAWCAVLLASFYVNIVSWAYLSALEEKRGAGAATRGESTSVHMPRGLIEGTETIVAYLVMLLAPQRAELWFALMATLVALTVVQRVVWATARLR